MQNSFSEDGQRGISLLEWAEAHPDDHRLFCRKFREGVDYLLDYLADEQDVTKVTYIENFIISHAKRLFSRLPSIPAEDQMIWLGYLGVTLSIYKYQDRIFEDRPELLKYVADFAQIWADEIDSWRKK